MPLLMKLYLIWTAVDHLLIICFYIKSLIFFRLYTKKSVEIDSLTIKWPCEELQALGLVMFQLWLLLL